MNDVPFYLVSGRHLVTGEQWTNSSPAVMVVLATDHYRTTQALKADYNERAERCDELVCELAEMTAERDALRAQVEAVRDSIIRCMHDELEEWTGDNRPIATVVLGGLLAHLDAAMPCQPNLSGQLTKNDGVLDIARLNTAPVSAGKTFIDLDAAAWAQIKEAASQSAWMPEQYFMNDWVSDVCAFLREQVRDGEVISDLTGLPADNEEVKP